MKKINWIIFVLFLSWHSFNYASDLAQPFYIDQKDQRFYQRGLIPKNNSSSLCGPVSLVNIIISDLNTKELTENTSEELLNEIITISNELKVKENIDVNNGLVEYELIKYIELFKNEHQLNITSSFLKKKHHIYGQTFYGKELNQHIIQSKFKQIWQIKIEEKKTPSYGGPKPRYPRDPFEDYQPEMPGLENPVRIFHYISKIKNLNENEFSLIDPENPKEELILKLETINDPQTKKVIFRLIPKSPGAFKNFSIRPPYTIELKSIIE